MADHLNIASCKAHFDGGLVAEYIGSYIGEKVVMETLSRKGAAADVAIMFPNLLSVEQQARVKEILKKEFPDRKFLVLTGGATVASIDNERLIRIEAKLDALLAALDEEDDEAPAFGLDGDLVPGERDQDAEL